ncbi:hypothetical protein KUL150_36990 [Alteromonas sp. KUL150]|nr:hypothetical protein KUL150_36990 [Alteromonas sp. KUL150]
MFIGALEYICPFTWVMALVVSNFVLKRWANIGFWDSYIESVVFPQWVCHVLHGLPIFITLLAIY